MAARISRDEEDAIRAVEGLPPCDQNLDNDDFGAQQSPPRRQKQQPPPAEKRGVPLPDDMTAEELAARPKQPKDPRKDSSTGAYDKTKNKWWPAFLKAANWDAGFALPFAGARWRPLRQPSPVHHAGGCCSDAARPAHGGRSYLGGGRRPGRSVFAMRKNRRRNARNPTYNVFAKKKTLLGVREGREANCPPRSRS